MEKKERTMSNGISQRKTISNVPAEKVRIKTGVIFKIRSFINSKLEIIAILLLIAALSYLGVRYKSFLVVAKVDNGYIYRWELDRQLFERYGETTLEELVNISLVKNELSKRKVTVEESEVNQRVSEIERGLQGSSLEEALKTQGMTLDQLKEQVYLQLGMEKLLSERISVSDEELTQFITDYETALTSTDEEGKKKEAEKILRDQKLQQEISTWIGELKSTTKVSKYI